MSHLKHPIRSIREPFGKAGLTVAICALVLAMVGGAYAAGGLTKSQEKQVKKIAKKYAGKPGAPGANGTNGTQGANGTAGAAGTNGTNGSTVLNGTGTPSNTLGNNGDFYIDTAASKIYGPKAAGAWPGGGTSLKGAPGQPWTLGGTLPASTEPGCPCTETGAWAVTMPEFTTLAPNRLGIATISFTIQLASVPALEVLKEGEGETTNCPGTAAEPKAANGFLCMYASKEFPEGEVSREETGTVGTYGATESFSGSNGGYITGSWAVTAE